MSVMETLQLLSQSGISPVSPSVMQESDPLTLSECALSRLFGDALHVGTASAPPESPEWWQDPKFPYVPVSFVGRGGSGFVWKASRRDGHGFVALKLVPFRSDPVRLQQRWQDECAALAKIQHPNLVALIDHGRSPDGLSGWLAMEWIEGTCLGRKLTAEAHIFFKEILAIVPQAVAGLSALHGAGMVHRDIKPSNLLLESETGRLVIADLGIALDLGSDPDQRVTRTFEQPLTPGYFPPELLHASYRPDALGDQYSLAFTLWQLLTGTMPLGAFAKLHRLCKCPAGLDSVLRKALATAPANRYPDLAAFGQAFRQAASRPPRSHLLLGFIALLAIAATIFWLSRPPTFPKRFQSGRIQVNEGREHHMRIDMTLQQDGRFLAKIRTTCLDPIFGFDGRAHLIFRGAKGEIVHTLITHGYGVNGRFIPGGKHDRLDDWKSKIPAEAARRVATVNFLATPSAGTLEQRAALNHKEFHKDLKSIKSGAVSGLDALSKMFSPIPPKKKAAPEAK